MAGRCPRGHEGRSDGSTGSRCAFQSAGRAAGLPLAQLPQRPRPCPVRHSTSRRAERSRTRSARVGGYQVVVSALGRCDVADEILIARARPELGRGATNAPAMAQARAAPRPRRVCRPRDAGTACPCWTRTALRSQWRALSASASASLIRSAARHGTAITPRSLGAVGLSPAVCITAMISSVLRWLRAVTVVECTRRPRRRRAIRRAFARSARRAAEALASFSSFE